MNLKRQAAQYALKFVKSGMALGLGTGSTTAYFIDSLGESLAGGELEDICCVPTSKATAERALELGIPLTTLNEHPRLDLAVDGADEVDPALNLIKGLGRAALREKMVESQAERFIVVVDESKFVPRLGRGPLPVEIVTFEAAHTVRWLNSLGCRAEQWFEADGAPVLTDDGNYLARCWFPHGIPNAYALNQALLERPGVVGHGLFLDLATHVIIAAPEGIRKMEREV